ncbi:MAG: YraN family protein [Muribaculaceae bacterium]|nr:YraN family protein [Muribaculaceae bacterium]
MGRENKLRDQAFGKFAEDKATEYYISRGYAIRERNWRCHRIEIDIIAQTGNVMVFVEVKARSGKDMGAAESVTLSKMKSMTRGADIYLKSQKGDYEYRYDIFALTGDFEEYTTEVIEDAFVSPLLR